MKLRIGVILLLLTAASDLQAAQSLLRLKVSDNHRFLMKEDGSPFFYQGDTAWELFHRLKREEADIYLADRAQKKFTVLQAVILAELDGLHTPNAYGQLPLVGDDPTKPNEEYFRHVDYIVSKTNELGMYIGMLPTWGSWWNKPAGQGGIFTPQNAEVYGRFLGQRYKDSGIIWILGGDRPIQNSTHLQILRAMAKGLKEGDGGAHLITLHPPGGHSSAEWLHDESWLDFNMLQTGHDINRDTWDRIARDYDRTPIKPVTDGEPLYEDHPIAFNPKNGFSKASDVRKYIYWDLFAGSFGYTYGCHDIWQFWQPGRKPISWAKTSWREALKLPASGQVQYARALTESRPFFTRVPDQSVIASDPGTGAGHLQATRDSNGSYAFIYTPLGKTFKVHMEKISGPQVKASWYDPRTGKWQAIGQFANQGEREFTPPSNGEGNDWVLVLDDAGNADSKRVVP